MKKAYLIYVVLGLIIVLMPITAQTWKPAVRLTWNTTQSMAPSIAADSGSNIYIAWDDSLSGNYEIYFKRSSDNGSNWSGLHRITWTSGVSSNPCLVVDSNNNIYLAWHDDVSGNCEIYLKSSTNGGTSWSPLRRVTWNSGASYTPVIAVAPNDDLHVVWSDYTPGSYEIFHKRSTDGGITWGSTHRLTWSTSMSSSQDITSDSNNNIHVVWSNYFPASGNEIYYKKSTDGGSSWSAVQRLTWNTGYSYMPSVAADLNNRIHVVWYDGTPGNMEIFYKRSTNNGSSWSGVTRLTWNSTASTEPDLMVDSCNYLHLVWTDSIQTNGVVLYKSSFNSGSSWSAIERLTWTSNAIMMPCITEGQASSLHVAWQYYINSNYEIYYKQKSL